MPTFPSDFFCIEWFTAANGMVHISLPRASTRIRCTTRWCSTRSGRRGRQAGASTTFLISSLNLVFVAAASGCQKSSRHGRSSPIQLSEPVAGSVKPLRSSDCTHAGGRRQQHSRCAGANIWVDFTESGEGEGLRRFDSTAQLLGWSRACLLHEHQSGSKWVGES